MLVMTEEKSKVLIVDDDPTVLQTICSYLNVHYQLSIAKSKAKALELIKGGDFSLILLDVNLPDGSGLEICTEMKSSFEYADSIAIILMTSEYAAEQEAAGLRLGAVDYVYKPLNESVLLARIALQLDIQRKTALLSKLANVDGLTEIGNRRAFDFQLESELNRARRENKEVALAMIDIDCFKQYNDNYGHPAGDKVLVKLANTLRSQFKRHSDFCFRYGGEEFSVLMYDTNEVEASRLLLKCLEAFRQLKLNHDYSPVAPIVTFSAGVVAIPAKDTSVSELVKLADECLYQAKLEGKNQIKSNLTQLA